MRLSCSVLLAGLLAVAILGAAGCQKKAEVPATVFKDQPVGGVVLPTDSPEKSSETVAASAEVATSNIETERAKVNIVLCNMLAVMCALPPEEDQSQRQSLLGIRTGCTHFNGCAPVSDHIS